MGFILYVFNILKVAETELFIFFYDCQMFCGQKGTNSCFEVYNLNTNNKEKNPFFLMVRKESYYS